MKLEKGKIFTAQVGDELISYRVVQFNGPGWVDHGQLTLRIIQRHSLNKQCLKCRGTGVITPELPPEDIQAGCEVIEDA